MSGDTFGAPESLSYNPASVEMPPLPSIQPGADALSMAIAAVLPEMHAGLQTSVSATQAKDGMLSEKVGDAKGKYQNADDQGGQSVGKMGSMLGQLGEMAQKAGQSAGGGGGGSSMFSQLMEQAMKAAEGAGGSKQDASPQAGQSPEGQGQPAGGQPGQPAGAQPGTAPQRAENAAPQEEPRQETREHESREHDNRENENREQQHREPKAHESPAHQPPVEAAGPGDRQHAAGPAPVAPSPHPRPGSDDLARRM